jgi:hypothetical protein
MKRAVFLLAALFAGAVMAAPMASAQSDGPAFANDDDYAALCIPLTVDNASPAPGDTVHVSGTAASGGATIWIVLNNETKLAELTSDPTNHFFSGDVVIPLDAPSGANTLQAFQIGDSTDPIVGCPAQVAALDIVRPAVAAEPLARTGSSSTMPLVRLGFGLLVAGGMAMLVSRKHKSKVTATA